MRTVPVDSSHIAAIGYDPLTRHLHVEFRNGAVYHFEGVPPEAHKDFMESPSKGVHFHAYIRPAFAFVRSSATHPET